MSKYLLLFTISLLLINSAKCRALGSDTAIMYFRYVNGIGVSVHTLDSANYFMLIFPPDSTDAHFNIKGFFKDGKVKFIGKGDPSANSLKTGSVILDGDYISFYQNGKRESIVQYKKGYKDGFEFLYYPDGTIYCSKRYRFGYTIFNGETLYWDCYDSKGNKICKEGDGHWIMYGDSVKTIKLEGAVKKGYMDGVWHGSILAPDTIKYIYQYKKGEVSSSISYDKMGKAYSFRQEFEQANYKHGQLSFLEELRRHIKVPRDANGKKMVIDTMSVSFIIEKDGRLSQFTIPGNADQQIKDAVFTALQNFTGWSPQKIYGIPFRTEITIPLKAIWREFSNYSINEVYYQERLIR